MEGVIIPELSPREQAAAVKETEYNCREAKGKEGDRVYLISNKWFSQWCQHTGFSYDAARKRVSVATLAQPGPRPGPIDSSDLLAEEDASGPAGGRLPDLSEEERARTLRLRDPLPVHTYFEARQPTYDLLKSWYGAVEPEVYVELMQVGPAKRVELDLPIWHLKAVLEASEAETTYKSAVVAVCKQATVSDLKRKCCAALGVSENDYEIMDFYGMEKADKLENKSFKTLHGANLFDEQAVLLRHKDRVKELEEEEKAEAAATLVGSPPLALMSSSPARGFGTSPLPSSPLSRSHSKPPMWAEDVIQSSASRRRGLAGLGNLGNTCFMNSSVQCLAHTVPVMETFLGGEYEADINADNPLGMGGKLALAFGSLMEKLWQGGVSSVSPKRFKWQLARFAPQFQGYAQQDSQELLAFLLDGLHEDLNRIKNKPYIEEKDDDGRPDLELAQEAWTNYRARNDSVIVDNFQGLYKSTLVCPRCQHKSRKFDPFMYLSLPLPTAKTRAFSIVVVAVDGAEPPLQYSVEVPKTATIRQLTAALGKLCGVGGDAPEKVLLLAQYSIPGLYGSPKTELLIDLEARVSSIKEPSRGFMSSKSLLLAYRYPDAASGPLSGKAQVTVVHKSRGSGIAAPPVPLFLGAEELGSLQLERAKPASSFAAHEEWAVAGPGSALDLATRRLLRPFRRHPEAEQDVDPVAPPAPAAADVPALPVEEAMSDAGGDEPGAASPAEGDGEAMDLEQPDTPPTGLQDASPSGSARSSSSDVAMADRQASASTPAAPAAFGPQLPPSDEPFNMWPQQESSAEPTSAAAGAQGLQQQQHSQPKEPYRLKLATGPDGKVRVAEGSAEAAPDLAAEQPPLYFVAEWSSEGAQEYDPQLVERPAKHQSALDAEAAAARGSKSVTLAECMETFLQPEQLDAEDSWYCSQCKEHVQADKKLDLWSLPEVLVVHLKRFSYSRYSRDKLDTRVDFPLERLDLSRYLLLQQQQQQQQPGGQQQQGSCVYDLYAVSNHYGGLGGGHYTAYCKMPDDGRWYLFDDSSVRESQPGDVVSSAAYVLFYRRAGSKADLGALFGRAQGAEGMDAQAAEAAGADLPEPEMQFSVGSL